MVEWVQIDIITVIKIFWHDITLSLSLSAILLGWRDAADLCLPLFLSSL
jgi:hypothetical protein